MKTILGIIWLRPEILNNDKIKTMYRKNIMFYVKNDSSEINIFPKYRFLPFNVIHPNMGIIPKLISVKHMIRIQKNILRQFIPLVFRAIKRRISKKNTG